MVVVTNLDERYCHKWALLLRERNRKLDSASALIQNGDFKAAKLLFGEIFFGVAGKQADLGMTGSLLYARGLA